jgi:hypothetical protein
MGFYAQPPTQSLTLERELGRGGLDYTYADLRPHPSVHAFVLSHFIRFPYLNLKICGLARQTLGDRRRLTLWTDAW